MIVNTMVFAYIFMIPLAASGLRPCYSLGLGPFGRGSIINAPKLEAAFLNSW